MNEVDQTIEEDVSKMVFNTYMEEGVEQLLPHWAIAKNDNSLVLGASLPTRDGRRTGNAHIIEIKQSDHGDYLLYVVLTDAGSTVNFTEQELRGQYFDSEWISDVEELKVRFGNGNYDQEIYKSISDKNKKDYKA